MVKTTHELIVYEAKFGNQYAHDSKVQDTVAPRFKGRHRAFIEDYSAVDSDNYVFLEGKEFARIFGDRHADTGYKNKLAIVKVTNPANGKSIHRQFRTLSNLHRQGWDDYAILTYYSLIKLVNSQDELDAMNKVEVSKGSIYKYYWNHPYHATQISTRIGVFGVFISVISLIISLICLFVAK